MQRDDSGLWSKIKSMTKNDEKVKPPSSCQYHRQRNGHVFYFVVSEFTHVHTVMFRQWATDINEEINVWT